MQWNKTNNSNNMFKVSILLTFTLLLFSLPAPVHGATLALVHRNHDRFTGGKMDRLEAVKGFVQRDNHRRLQINQRLGYDDDHDTRRRAAETDEAEMPLLTGRDLGIGEYFVEVKVGTPGQKLWLAADTGSEFTWFNCLSLKKTDIPHQRPKKKHPHHARSHHHKTTKNHTKAKKKAKNHKNDPCTGVYCPDKSRTFHSVTCASRKCKVDLSDLFSLTYCPNPSDPCLYDIGFVKFLPLLFLFHLHAKSHLYVFSSDLHFYYNNMHFCLMTFLVGDTFFNFHCKPAVQWCYMVGVSFLLSLIGWGWKSFFFFYVLFLGGNQLMGLLWKGGRNGATVFLFLF